MIKLTNSNVSVLVDSDDYERLSKMRWRLEQNGRYASVRSKINQVGFVLLMHRFIMNAPEGVKIDHINGNGLDNRKSNLRFASNSQNGQNQIKRKLQRSGYKGVSLHKGKWRARIVKTTDNGKKEEHHIGYFPSALAAAHAYDRAAVQMFGQFANLNFKCTA